jgi:diadenylate cyclase
MSDILPILAQLNFISVLDILLVALVFYWLLTLIQGTQAVQLLRGILVLSVLAAIVASAFNSFIAFEWLIGKALPALLVSIPIIFQPELRRALDRLGRTSKIFASPHQKNTQIEKAIMAVCDAVGPLSQQQHGALIVFERSTGLGEYVETGVKIDAWVSAELIRTIFYPNTALHDGGIIIRGDKVIAGGVVLPLGVDMAAQRQTWMGTRHRAALGLTQLTDAIVVVVSEETGTISVAHNGQFIRGLDKKRLEQILIAFYKAHLAVDGPTWRRWGQSVFRRVKSARWVKAIGQARSQPKQ